MYIYFFLLIYLLSLSFCVCLLAFFSSRDFVFISTFTSYLLLFLLLLLLGGAFVVCITLSSAPWCFEHCGIGRWLQTSGRWSVILKSRIWSYPGGDKYSFVDDVCPQYLHCTDEDQQSETARLSTVSTFMLLCLECL